MVKNELLDIGSLILIRYHILAVPAPATLAFLVTIGYRHELVDNPLGAVDPLEDDGGYDERSRYECHRLARLALILTLMGCSAGAALILATTQWFLPPPNLVVPQSILPGLMLLLCSALMISGIYARFASIVRPPFSLFTKVMMIAVQGELRAADGTVAQASRARDGERHHDDVIIKSGYFRFTRFRPSHSKKKNRRPKSPPDPPPEAP